ncbi:MAG: hypothetical protein M1358_02355 [Chloroflexi bacterium]|nr:hypothetical protein [Chloroflexota bacterium]
MQRLRLLSILLAAVLSLLAINVALAAEPIAIDGRFNDWSGREHITDKSGDGASRKDIHYFYWGTNDNDPNLYFMIERYSAGDERDDDSGHNDKKADKDREDERGNAEKVEYRVYIDTNDDGNFGSDVDRLVEIQYNPNQNNSNVQVDVSRPNGKKISHRVGNWGQSIKDGALKVEAGAPFADLGIVAHQTVRMYVVADERDRAPDSGDIQLSPIPILDYPLLATIVLGAIALVWWKRGRFEWRTS